MKTRVKTSWSLMARAMAIAAATVVFIGQTPAAHADTLLKAATTMVYGTSADTYSIMAPSAGTVTAQVSTVPWPEPLAALTFNFTDATNVLNPQSMAKAQALGDVGGPEVQTYQVGAGTYFAHVAATAAGALNLGLYSVMFTFTPSAVPLPASAAMLLIGLLVFLGLRRVVRDASDIEAATFGAAT
jgi:uncharacterized membrane protein